MNRGFTFQQLAVILLVVLGLIVIIVMVATQAQKAGGSIGEVGDDIGTSVTETGSLLTTCTGQGGVCGNPNNCDGTVIGTWKCDSGTCESDCDTGSGGGYRCCRGEITS